jgi:site-specific DNA-methyltransferase (adenine-specific)
MINLLKGDCLEVMKTIKSGSIDAIITDPPYGTTACKWDSVIDFDLMWEQLNRVIKPNGAVVLFGSEPFSSALRMSNIKNYKYDWVWQKTRFTGNLNAKRMPLKAHEIVSVFNCKGFYFPQKTQAPKHLIDKRKTINNSKVKSGGGFNGSKEYVNIRTKDDGTRYPTTIQKFKNPNNNSLHPTQKPILLMEYLIKTYTNENETILDFTMGSGSTMVACQNTNRNGIGIEQDETYFNIAQDRIKENKYKLFQQ